MKRIFIGIILTAIIASAYFVFAKKTTSEASEVIKPKIDAIVVQIRVTGSVEPRNRLEIKPQVSGRIEEILVSEGQRVTKGETLAWMSSTDRAALIDAARSKGESELKKWEEVYNTAPIISPIDGFITARYKEPGQSVSLSDVILVAADKLIVKANVDETDLRNIKNGQSVDIILDAYPDMKFPGAVVQIAYESQVINNVTVYEVKIQPARVPESFRSGMTATVEVIAQKKENILIVPVEAVSTQRGGKYVYVVNKGSKKPIKTKVVTGISNEINIEIISGITVNDTLVIEKKNGNKTNTPGQVRGPMSMFGGTSGGSRR